MAKAAVRFGAGNMGRDFVAEWHEGDCEVGCPDVSKEFSGRPRARDSHETTEAGEGVVSRAPDNHRAINSRTRDALIMAETTPMVGGRILPLVAPIVAKGLAADVRAHAAAINAIERIVPEQLGGLDATIEWVVDGTPFVGSTPEIFSVIRVDDLELFTADTALAAAAHHGIDRFRVSTGEPLGTPTQPGLAR